MPTGESINVSWVPGVSPPSCPLSIYWRLSRVYVWEGRIEERNPTTTWETLEIGVSGINVLVPGTLPSGYQVKPNAFIYKECVLENKVGMCRLEKSPDTPC